MRLTITPTALPVFLLADDSVSLVIGSVYTTGAGGQIKEGFVNKQKRAVQRAPLFRAAYALIIPRFNLENRFAFTVQRSFQTLEACIQFIAYHPDSVPAQGEITLDNQSQTGRVIRYLPRAVIETVECVKHVGVACDFQYTISGNGPWQNSP